MRDDDHGAGTCSQHAFQPADGVDVQVVGRLIEQQDVRIGEQRLCQQHAQLPARRDFAHRPQVLLDGDIEAHQQLTGTRFGGVAIQLGEFDLEVGNLHAVFLTHLRQRVDAVTLGLDHGQTLVAHDDGVEHRVFLIGELVLTQLAQTDVGLEHDVTTGRLQIATENLHHGRLAAAVGADQAVAIATPELGGDVFKQRLGTELHGEIGGRDHEGISV